MAACSKTRSIGVARQYEKRTAQDWLSVDCHWLTRMVSERIQAAFSLRFSFFKSVTPCLVSFCSFFSKCRSCLN